MREPPHKEVRRFHRLESAWKRVLENGRKSRSKRTRNEVEEYGTEIHRHLRSIQSQLGHNSFAFDAARGWPEPPKEPGKKHRPIVITPVRSRIVQRAILDVLVEQPNIKSFVEQPYSFGGIKKNDPNLEAAVPGAIQAVVRRILDGSPYFIRSDIAGFFRQIPKPDVMAIIRSSVDDEIFCDLIESAIALELSNLDEISAHRDIFPLEDIGVAQGCALSPLLGNILLSDFDKDLNKGPCSCIRYIDDFLIVGPSEDDVAAAFSRAQSHLKVFGMVAYDPTTHKTKAELGHVEKDGICFLGVEIINGSIRPSAKNRGALVQSVKEIVDSNLKVKPSEEIHEKWNYNHSFLRCMSTINSVVSGWGNQYYFCNDRNIMNSIDQKISELLRSAFDDFKTIWRGFGYLGRRRLMGVKSLHDCKTAPIEWRRVSRKL